MQGCVYADCCFQALTVVFFELHLYEKQTWREIHTSIGPMCETDLQNREKCKVVLSLEKTSKSVYNCIVYLIDYITIYIYSFIFLYLSVYS